MKVWSPNIASCYQEILTVAARLRSRRFAVGDSAAFRTQVRKALEAAQNSARSLRYEEEDIRLASYATISLLDEVILNSSDPVFRDWARKPLMLDLFKTGTAGEGFFENLRTVLERKESKNTIDLLEVHLLCLQLGFCGRFAPGYEEKLHPWRNAILEKLQRNRPGPKTLQISPGIGSKDGLEPVLTPQHRLTAVALSATAAGAAVAVISFLVFRVLLSSGLSEVIGSVSK